MLRVLLWLGLEQDQSEWARAAPGGEVAVFAETYENNVGCFVCVVVERLYIYIYGYHSYHKVYILSFTSMPILF